MHGRKKNNSEATQERRECKNANADTNKEEKGNWDSKRLLLLEATLYEFQSVEQRSYQSYCLWCFQILYFRKLVFILGHNFVCPIWRTNVNFMQHSFSNCGNPAKPHSRINPGSSMDGIVNTTVKVSLYCAVLSWGIVCFRIFSNLGSS